MEKRRVLFSGLVVLTLVIGVAIGTVVSERVSATEQAPPARLTVPDPVELSSVFRQVASQVSPAVVHINTKATLEAPAIDGFGGVDPFEFFFGNPDVAPGQREARGLGSGFIVDPNGYIVTNNHVIDGADDITVRLPDESEYPATIIGTDRETDIAVIKIEADAPLPVARMGNSDSMLPGDWVLALGSPFGFDNTLTAGIVSAIGRPGGVDPDNPGRSMQFQSFIQTDAAINPGNSGGPLVNMNGEVIGINTAIITSTESFAGIGFALPSNTVVDVYNQLSTAGRVTRGSIGIMYSAEQDPVLLENFGVDYGVIVQDVTPAGPAERAGFEPGDVITEIDGQQITDGDTLLRIVSGEPVGTTVPIEIRRLGEDAPRTLDVTIGDRTEVHPPSNASTTRDLSPRRSTPSRLGIEVQDLTPEARSLMRGRNPGGVMISSVEQGSNAEEAGLVRGMIITRIVPRGGQPVTITNVQDFRRAEGRLESGDRIVLEVLIQDTSQQDLLRNFRPMVVP